MKNSLRNAISNAIGFIFPAFIVLITTPYIVHKLGAEIYGIYVLAISLMGLLSFLDLGFGQGIIKFVSHYEAKGDFNKINDIINTSFVINILMGLLGFILIFSLSSFLSEKIFKVNREHLNMSVTAFKIVAFGFLLNILLSTFSNIPRALQRYDIAVIIQNVVWFSSVISSVILLYLGYGLIEMLVAYIVFQIFGSMLYFYISKKLLPFMKISLTFKEDVFNEIFRFSIFVSLNVISGNIVTRLDKMIVSHFLGTSSVSFYAIPYNLASMVSSFVGSINQFLFPAISSLKSKGDESQIKYYFRKSLDYTALISTIIIIVFIIFSDWFIELWLGREFSSNSYRIAPLLGFTYFFSCLSSVSLWYYTAFNKTHINLISSLIGSGSYLIGSLLLIPLLGLKGAALSFMFILLPFPVYNLYISKIVGVGFKEYTYIILPYIILTSISLLYILFWNERDLLKDFTFCITLLFFLFVIKRELIFELIKKISRLRVINA